MPYTTIRMHSHSMSACGDEVSSLLCQRKKVDIFNLEKKSRSLFLEPSIADEFLKV